jgi:hypothetical protein
MEVWIFKHEWLFRFTRGLAEGFNHEGHKGSRRKFLREKVRSLSKFAGVSLAAEPGVG